MKIHTHEQIFQVMTRLWPGNEKSYTWANCPGNEQVMTPSLRHIVILPKLQEIGKLLDGWCRIAHGTILPHYLLFDGILAHIFTSKGHKKWNSNECFCCLRISILLSLYCSLDWNQKSVFFSTKPVPDGIIVLIALSVLSYALQDLSVHPQEISLDFNTLSIRKT